MLHLTQEPVQGSQGLKSHHGQPDMESCPPRIGHPEGHLTDHATRSLAVENNALVASSADAKGLASQGMEGVVQCHPLQNACTM